MSDGQTRMETMCQCGQKVAVIRDADDPCKLHFECHACGESKTLTIDSKPTDAKGKP